MPRKRGQDEERRNHPRVESHTLDCNNAKLRDGVPMTMSGLSDSNVLEKQSVCRLIENYITINL